jgi:hypothetical protein
MIYSAFYLSDEERLEEALSYTGLAIDELESIVGRFHKNHWRWPGKLKGELMMFIDGEARIRHHFNKKVLWRSKGE